MTLRLGNPTYSPVKDFAELQGDMASVGSDVSVQEGRILQVSNGYAFCMIASHITDLKQLEAFKPGTPVCWIAHDKEYERWTFDNPKLIAQPTPIEELLVEWLNGDGKDWLNKSFKGKLHLNGAASVIAAIKKGGFYNAVADFEECEPNLIKEDSLKEKGKSKSGSGGGSKNQSEAERLSEYQSFVITAAGVHGEGCKTLIDVSFGLTGLKRDSPEVFAIFMELLKTASPGNSK